MLFLWSTTAGNNANVGSINWAEGMPPSAVNNSARQMMADVADYVNNPGPEWYQHDSAAYASGTTFSVPGDQTGWYLTGRRLLAVNAATTIYGTVVSATYSTNTTVTALWDSGSLDAGLSSLKTGILSPQNVSVPVTNGLHLDGVATLSSTAVVGLYVVSNASSASMRYQCSGGLKTVGVNSSSTWAIANSAGTINILTVDDGGHVTAAGDVTGVSDERLKDEWAAMPDDFVDRLANVLSGSFIRNDELPPKRHVGVGAQSLEKLMPHAVMTDKDGLKSVAYGQAAMVACVELAKEVRSLRKLLKKAGIQ